ncbi:Hypothetical protein SRAE_0000066050 [Strongyloides ratti]|uniref:Uncharacterized protein n=1 Tax=Strongyloides ratti TaxID=34506 RepID=A0A090L228_STRRB|nr:Hypothetical protein SRAE_0000066050 [Strongyloides ratti]CEF61539.1 Hypothetical protein SRAE_0000066050 [Strongyloides ratti]
MLAEKMCFTISSSPTQKKLCKNNSMESSPNSITCKSRTNTKKPSIQAIYTNKFKLTDEYLGIRYDTNLHKDLLLITAFNNRKLYGK